MKKMYYMVLLTIIILSCDMDNKGSFINKNIIISDANRSLINGLNLPVVDYILYKDGEVYKTMLNIPLVEQGGTYIIDLELLSGSTYYFSQFTIKADGIIKYILDVDNVLNSDGFSISNDGVFSIPPKVYLKKTTDILYDNLNYESLSVEIVTDESSFLDPVPLTFKVSSNIPDAVFKIYKYTIYWVSGPELLQNEIYDMDTGNIFDPLIDGDGDPWGSGKFKIETTNGLGETVFIVGFSEEWSKKHIHLVL